ncbi:UDP-glucuronosyl/UDP-glucosyltransferase [Corchorus olitorius]|uniref:UDP-glucuronosyl/UDP-glucosyltransferase n=1 Tax=Corchorus olitorius TaxID=93759 RepID=A0A1R3GX74_9ROSI|nr:UDP-glucuronosyl/UDP-glucosyltransferase [Corchorus olitorius]
MAMRQKHVIVIPHAAQGHVAPLMKLSLQIVAHGVKVTFVTTEFIHGKIMASLPAKIEEERSLISLVSIPDGLEPADDRQDFVKLTESMFRVMPGHLRSFIENINQSNVNEQITCVIADMAAGWALGVAKELGIKNAAVLLSGPATLALALHVPKLIEAGIIDIDGTLMKDEPITLTEDIPAWNSSELSWSSGDPVMQRLLFSYVSTGIQAFISADEIGLALDKDENGIITSNEISRKIETLLSSDEIKANALQLKESARKSVGEGGSSFKNFTSFIEQI